MLRPDALWNKESSSTGKWHEAYPHGYATSFMGLPHMLHHPSRPETDFTQLQYNGSRTGTGIIMKGFSTFLPVRISLDDQDVADGAAKTVIV